MSQLTRLSPFQAEIHLGEVLIKPALVLAPMSGVTNISFRRLLLRENPGCIGLVMSEFISVEALTRKNEQSLRMLRYDRKDESPIGIQIFGYDVYRMAEAAKMVEDTGVDLVDINCGCPAPKVVKKGGGCELMRQPQHLGKIISAVRQAVSIPVTVKIRAGWSLDSRNALEVAKTAEDNGAQLLSIHGRTRQEMYRGLADWELVARVVDALSIPVFGSGDVMDFPSAQSRWTSGVSGLMIGRAALSNPWIFRELEDAYHGRPIRTPGPRETTRVLRTYLGLLRETFPEKAILGRLKQLASQVTRRVSGSKRARAELCRVASIEHFLAKLDEFDAFISERPCPPEHFQPEQVAC